MRLNAIPRNSVHVEKKGGPEPSLGELYSLEVSLKKKPVKKMEK